LGSLWQTPVVRTSLNHHQRPYLFGAILVPYRKKRLRLTIRSYTNPLSGTHVIAFLKQLLQTIPGEIVLLWDNHPIHLRKLVAEFIDQEPRLHVEWFPTCAPELNRAKFIWAQRKEHTASTSPRDIPELRGIVLTGIAKIRRSQSRLQACLSASDLSWK
jgi:transposase